jgi:hypothetical protein
MQYSALTKLLEGNQNRNADGTVTLSEELFRTLIIKAVKLKNEFDEDFYIKQHNDIREALKSRAIPSAADHYFNTGYFEGRMPKRFMVDERFYLKQNPDVADAIKKGVVRTAQEHFEYSGFQEGRIPYEGFSMF